MNKKSVFLKVFAIFCLILQFFNISVLNNVSFAYHDKSSKKSEVLAESMATIEASTGKILYSKDENKKLPMASTTKILTAIVAIENCDDLNKKHKIPKEAVGIEGSSIYLKVGEHLSVKELLYGLMLRSGNDSAVAIAIIVGGSLENFVKMMNDKCKELKLENTNIETVNGLHSENHYTTAIELAKITAYALKNKTFKEIVSTKFTKIDNELGKKDKVRYLKNKNKLLSMIEGADGVKTGYTTKAGKCFVGSATRNGMTIISVVLNAKSMFDESAKYIEKAFAEYSFFNVLKKGVLCEKDLKITDKKSQKVNIFLKKDVVLLLKNDEINKIKAKVEIKDDLKKCLKSNENIGELKLYLENDLIFSEKLYTINIDCNDTLSDKFHKIIKCF